jgi:urease accessory protein
MQLNFQEKGRAALEVDCIFKESTVTGAYATSPMKLLTPRSRGQCVCTYAGNFGGGLVAGDQTRLELRVGKQARCFLGTQASTKVYRNPHALPCSHLTSAALEADALLVFAPAPVQPFAESRYRQKQVFRLAPGAGLALLDWFTSGRVACGERWAFAHFSTRNEVWQSSEENGTAGAPLTSVDGASAPSSAARCVFLDSCCLDSTDGCLASAHRTGRFNCFALLVLVGAPLKKLAERLLEEVRGLAVKRRSTLLVSASPIEGGSVLRVAGEQVGEVDQYLRKHLSPLTGLLGEDPWSRRW